MSVVKPAIRHPALIAYLAGANNYTWLHFRNGEKKMLAKPISYLETQLTEFIRVHKTALVNPACVEKLQQPPRQRMAGSVQLEGGIVLPVSRRRWREVATALQPYLSPDGEVTAVAAPEPEKVVEPPITPLKSAESPATPTRTVLLATEDSNTQSIKWALESRWPQYVLHTSVQSSHLPRVLSLLSADELPTLIILDARTSTLERLNTLQQLKEDEQFGQIPIVMLVPPIDDAITDSYRRRANSVISIPDSQTPLGLTIERISQFWLRTAALPVAL
ncbi:LytTR family transcriptional regulator DNA-binding domain-containing protein [Fibrella forsythiae]|uniref:LytTR family transcriptional regulator DNA-binding domain-containing protein n=1 Tax=Fibrella forsythiae TaxID=2817061 RepID=A0ABS3JMQ0_9BACT|nr:LytTR family transcriptional regulator DNA-binding domain-containing protein [Fibrella forsythiae]MBO0951290.1 LytTR family transcriptional regulator DNA-binding domain-containing protein [Fibrella forsythiae]